MKRHELREKYMLGSAKSGYRGHKGSPGRGGSLPRGGALSNISVDDVLATIKDKKPFHHGEWSKGSRGVWKLTADGFEYEIHAKSSTIYSKGRLRDPSKTKHIRDLEIQISKVGADMSFGRGITYKSVLSTTARGESALERISKNQARIVKRMDSQFGITPDDEFDWE